MKEMDEALILSIGQMMTRCRSIYNRATEWMLVVYGWSLFEKEGYRPECLKKVEDALAKAGGLLADMWDGLGSPTLEAYVGWVKRFDELCGLEEAAEESVKKEWNRFHRDRGIPLKFPGGGP